MGGASVIALWKHIKAFVSLLAVRGDSYLLFRCWMLPRHLKRPLTMMAMRVHKASHSSMLPTDREETL